MSSCTYNPGINSVNPTAALSVVEQSLTSQNISDNTSVVRWELILYRPSSISSSANKSYSVTVNGSTVRSGSVKIGGSGSMTVASGTSTIPHNTDGSKSISFSFSLTFEISWNVGYISTGSASGSMTLSTIPRASSINLSPSTITLGNNISISISRASSAFTHTLQYDFGTGSWTTFTTGATTSGVLSTKVDWSSVLPNSTSGTGRIRCITYNGGSYIGEKITNFTGNVPDSVKPTISSITANETVKKLKNAGFTSFIQGNSIPQISITANGVYGSTITAYSTTIESGIYSGNNFTSGVLNNSGEVTVTTSVSDSRGRKAEKSISITVLEYNSPSISLFDVQRCKTDGAISDSETNAKITAMGSISSCMKQNKSAYKIFYKLTSATTWIELISGTGYTINLNTIKTIVNGFLITNSYNLKLTLEDSLTSSTSEKVLQTAFTLMDWNSSGKGIGIGKVSEKDSLEVALSAEFSGGITSDGKNLTTLITPSTTAPSQTTNSIWMKIIDSSKKKFLMYVKEAAGHVIYKLSSQGVEMDNGNTLQQEFDNKISLITEKNITSSIYTYDCLIFETKTSKFALICGQASLSSLSGTLLSPLHYGTITNLTLTPLNVNELNINKIYDVSFTPTECSGIWTINNINGVHTSTSQNNINYGVADLISYYITSPPRSGILTWKCFCSLR